MNVRFLFALALAATMVYGAVGAAAPTNPEERLDNPAALSPEANAPRGNLLWAVPLKTLTSTRERPIFRPARRPAAVPAAVAEPAVKIDVAPEPPRLALVGTVAGGSDGIAVFVNQTTRDVVRLRTGEGLEGWTVREVKGREVVLERAQETVVFALPAPGEGRTQSPGGDPAGPR